MHEGDLIIQVGKHNVQDLTEARINSLLAQPAKRLEVFIVSRVRARGSDSKKATRQKESSERSWKAAPHRRVDTRFPVRAAAAPDSTHQVCRHLSVDVSVLLGSATHVRMFELPPCVVDLSVYGTVLLFLLLDFLVEICDLRCKNAGSAEDFLQKPRKGEPSTVKAVVHNQYNSPLQLYSQEKVAETLAYHAQAITAEDGVNDIQPVGLPKTLVRSAVLQALTEDETGANPYRTANGTTVVQRATAPPTPPPKPRPPSYSSGSPQPERPYSSSGHHVTFSNPVTPGTPPVQQHHTYIPPPPPLHSYQQPSYQQPSYQQPSYQQPSYQQPSYQQPSYQQPSYQQPSYQQQPASYPTQHARQSSYEEADRRQQQIREAELRQRQYEEERLQQAQYEEGRFRQPPQDFRRAEYDAEQRRLREEEERHQRVFREEEKRRQQEEQERKRRQEQQEYEQYQQHQQQYQRYLEEQKRRDDELRRRNAGQQQQQQQQPHHQYHHQQQQQHQQQEAARRTQLEEQQRRAQQQQQQQRYQNVQREPLNVQRAQEEAQRRYQPSTAVASSPQHQEQVGSQAQRWESRIWEEQQARMPGTPLGSPSVSRRARDNVWPPKESSVRWTPKTGFSPQLARQSSQGAKQFVWPPPKTGVANGDEGFPSRPPSRSAVNAWHPASPTSGTRTPPFARSPSLGRRTRDIAWPPPQAEASPKFVPRPVSRTGLHRPDEFIHQNASCGVPPTYRPPPNSSQYL
ncbi:hypothetical protein V5799_004653 [Amblyomma americanum]|uniref:Zasp-like motif domain-containing protein n=1 Tax=Amblyomma americanum TaxID=6943 RepID=A0AAQ4D5H5_AMBAM